MLFRKDVYRGFTLIELLVVISIISLLATLAVTSLNNAKIKARNSKRLADLKQLETAINLYFDDNDHYPYIDGVSGRQGKRCLGVANGGDCWSGTCGVSASTNLINDLSLYMANIPLDPSKRTVNAYLYGYGSFSFGCGGVSESGYWLMWQPDNGPAHSDAACLNMGRYGCCGSAGPCSCGDGYVCAYKISD